MNIKNKTILIQGAMDIEISCFLELDNVIEENINGFKFYKIKNDNNNNNNIIISKTEVGEINASMATLFAIEKYKPDYIINQGIAGAHDVNVNVGDIIVGLECININSYKIESNGYGEGSDSMKWKLHNWGEDVDLAVFSGDLKLIELIKNNEYEYQDGKIIYGRIGSGDIWNKEFDRIKYLNEKYLTKCEDMESISVYTICKKMNIPVLGIRIISNNELINEKYDRQASIKLQKFICKVCNL